MHAIFCVVSENMNAIFDFGFVSAMPFNEMIEEGFVSK